MEGAALMCILRVTAPAIIQYHMLRESIGFHILFFGRSTGYSLWFMRPKIFHVSGVRGNLSTAEVILKQSLCPRVAFNHITYLSFCKAGKHFSPHTV